MRLKLWIKKHRKGCLYLLIFIVLTRILLATHYVGATQRSTVESHVSSKLCRIIHITFGMDGFTSTE